MKTLLSPETSHLTAERLSSSPYGPNCSKYAILSKSVELDAWQVPITWCTCSATIHLSLGWCGSIYRCDLNHSFSCAGFSQQSFLLNPTIPMVVSLRNTSSIKSGQSF